MGGRIVQSIITCVSKDIPRYRGGCMREQRKGVPLFHEDWIPTYSTSAYLPRWLYGFELQWGVPFHVNGCAIPR